VVGVIFDLDECELPMLDKSEGAGKGYDRKDHFPVLIAGSHVPLDAVTYIASPSCIDCKLKPFDWYLNLVVEGARQHELSPEYVSALEATPSTTDPDTTRKSRMEAMELLRNSRT
jgi:hypothetical protein